MNKHSSYEAVKRFVNILEHSGLRKRLELSDEDIADTLWLALQMKVENTQTKAKPPQPPKERIQDTNIQPSKPVDLPIQVVPPPHLVVKNPKNEEDIEGLPFQTPAAPALTNKLQISRALRPLMRKVPSYYRRVLDVETTVNRIVDALIVEQDIWVPITKPQPERWLNLELVVEENRSSFIWQETIDELNQILENYGIFHSVRTWNLLNDNKGNLQLVSRIKGKQKKYRHYNYRKLYHSNGRGLILLVSDCVSTIWQRETIYQWLQKWSNQCPTAIMQLFPERLWLSSQLGLGYKVKLSALNPGVPNSKLICREDLDIEPALNLPIITLESESLKEWAKVVAGYGRIQTPAIVLDLEFVKKQVNQTVISQSSEVSPEAIVDRFLATASPTAQRLAGLMAAVPVSLPVVHLIQKKMLPKSTPVNVAEVFLSGMIERKKNVSSPVSLHKEEVKNREVHEYDFVAGVRKLLNQAMRLSETEKVLNEVSEYIADKMGLSFKNFTAMLLNLPDLSQEKQESLLPFAQVTLEVLHNLGGQYAEFAKKIETNKFQKIPDTFQEFTFESATIILIDDSINSQTFNFEVAFIKINQSVTPLKNSNEWANHFHITIDRYSAQATGFVQDLGNDTQLEMMLIPGGTFIMGSPPEELEHRDNESPQHTVTVQPFFLGKYPVTQAQWQFVAQLPKVNQELDPDPSHFKGENRPVENVSWHDTIEFCERLSQYTGKPYRLPSEAEWEYACRGGSTTPFHFGETITSDLANYDAKSTYGQGPKGIYRGETTPVGSFGVANAFGLCDMHGNVWEWCADHWHNNYEGAPVDGSAWLGNDNDNQDNMLRGGSWLNNPVFCRSACRNHVDAGYRDGSFGFRVACAAAWTQ
jgi:formylglycine-generating enzyme required for sulfatase activity